ncbi:MAG: hypothetical protein H7X92_07695 [Chitinophagales bacterium]|nr:hypothetical protein [Hyphomicrobiales bacterium]
MKLLRGFRRNEAGGVSVIFAVALAPLAFGVCAGIEISQAYMTRERINFALSASAEAWAQGGENADVMARSVFDGYAQHFPRRVKTELVITENQHEAALMAQTVIETPFLAAFGVSELDVTSTRFESRGR